MKKTSSVLLCVLLMFSLSVPSFATNNIDNNTIVEYMEDGSYFITTITVVEDFSVYATNTKTASKSTSYVDSDGTVYWKATLHASFRYTGSSATCTDAYMTYSTYDTSWKFIEKSASKSSNTATGNIIFKHYVLGIPVKTIDRTITMTCSANGTIS